MYTPLNYEQINLVESSVIPSTQKVKNTVAFDFWCRALYQRLLSVFNFSIPWESDVYDFFVWCLVKYGYVTAFNSNKFGFAFQPCTLSGYDFYYRPTKCIISNPKLNVELRIGEECELIKLTPDYLGIYSIVEYYAMKLADMDSAVNVAITNAKTPKIAGAKSKAVAEALKKIADKVNSGESFVVYDNAILDKNCEDVNTLAKVFETDKSEYILSNLLEDVQTIINAFDREIGIPTVPYKKKERMVEDEANSAIIDGSARCKIWIDCLNRSFEVVNKKYGVNLSVEYAYKEKGCEDVSEFDSNRNV